MPDISPVYAGLFDIARRLPVNIRSLTISFPITVDRAPVTVGPHTKIAFPRGPCAESHSDHDASTGTRVIPAKYHARNLADLKMSQRMLDLIGDVHNW